MKRAATVSRIPGYEAVRKPERHRLDYDRPGIGNAGGAFLPQPTVEVYIAGTEPVGTCPLHGGRNVTNVAGWDPASVGPAPVPPAPRVTGSGTDGVVPAMPPSRKVQGQNARAESQKAEPPPPAQPNTEQKKGFWRRLMGVFK